MIRLKSAVQGTLTAAGSLVAGYATAFQNYEPKTPEPAPIDVVIWLVGANDLMALAAAVVTGVGTWVTFSAAWNALKLDQVVEALERVFEMLKGLIDELSAQIWQLGEDGKARGDDMRAELAQQKVLLEQIVANQEQPAKARGVNAEKLRVLARRIVDKVSDVDEAERALSGVIDEWLKLRAEAKRGTNFGDEVDEAIRRIFAKVEANDLEGAEKQGRKEFERLKERTEELKAAQISLAESNLSVARIAYDAPAMADWALERRKLSEGVESLTLDQLRSERRDWYEEGKRLGDRLTMAVAIDLAQRSIDRSQTPQDRAMCQNDLGNALWVQGQRSGGEAGLSLLARAVKAYEAALSVHTQEETPADWAMTQNNLGNALWVQGQRSGGEAGLSLLTRAVAAYEAALSVRTQEEMPAQWAMTQNNLSGALLLQGERSGGEAGLSLLARAVAACEAALSVYTRKETPAHWAMTKENVAVAEEAWGDLSAGPARLERYRAAEDAVLAALDVYDADTMGFYHEKATRVLTRIRKKITAEPGG